MDKGTLYDRGLYAFVTGLADNNGIRWQTKQMIAGGTDASVIQRARAGARVCGIAAAIRNIHSPSDVAHIGDMEDLLKLARLFIAHTDCE
jgi:endoglucanase